jgi:uncharacterized protein DUF4340
MRSRLVTFGTLLVVFLLVLVTRFVDFEKDESDTPLLTLSNTEINRIEIQHGEEILKMAKSAQGEWEILGKNVQVKADPEKIGTLLDTFAEPRLMPISAQAENLKSFELEPPNRVISFSSASGVAKTIFIGRESPLGFEFYAKLPDSGEIYLMPEVMVLFLVADPRLFEGASVPQPLKSTRGVGKK